MKHPALEHRHKWRSPTHLTINIPQVRPRRNPPVDPTRGRNFRHQVARLLDVLLQNRDHGRVLLRKELLRNRAALLAHAHLLRVLKKGLQVLVAPAASHKGNGQERPGLGPCHTPIDLETRLVPHKRIGINGSIIVSVPLTRIDQQFIHGHRIHAGCIGHQVRCLVPTRAHRLRIVGLDTTLVIPRMRHAIDP